MTNTIAKTGSPLYLLVSYVLLLSTEWTFRIQMTTSFGATKLCIETKGFDRSLKELKPLSVVPHLRLGRPQNKLKKNNIHSPACILPSEQLQLLAGTEPTSPTKSKFDTSPNVVRQGSEDGPQAQAHKRRVTLSEINQRVEQLLDDYERQPKVEEIPIVADVSELKRPIIRMQTTTNTQPELEETDHDNHTPVQREIDLGCAKVLSERVENIRKRVAQFYSQKKCSSAQIISLINEVTAGISELDTKLRDEKSRSEQLAEEVTLLKERLLKSEYKQKQHLSEHGKQIRSMKIVHRQALENARRLSVATTRLRRSRSDVTDNSLSDGTYVVVFSTLDSGSLWTNHTELAKESCDIFVSTCRELTLSHEAIELHCNADTYGAAFTTALQAVQWTMFLQENLLKAPWSANLLRGDFFARKTTNTKPEATLWRGVKACSAVVSGDLRMVDSRFHGDIIAISKNLSNIARGGETLVAHKVHEQLAEATDLFECQLRGDLTPDNYSKTKEEDGSMSGINCWTYTPISLKERIYANKNPSSQEAPVSRQQWLTLRKAKNRVALQAIDIILQKCGQGSNMVASPLLSPKGQNLANIAYLTLHFSQFNEIWNMASETGMQNNAAKLFTNMASLTTQLVTKHHGQITHSEVDAISAVFAQIENAVVCSSEIHKMLLSDLVEYKTHENIIPSSIQRETYEQIDGNNILLWKGVTAGIVVHCGQQFRKEMTDSPRRPTFQAESLYKTPLWETSHQLAMNTAGGETLITEAVVESISEKLPSDIHIEQPELCTLLDEKLFLAMPTVLRSRLDHFKTFKYKIQINKPLQQQLEEQQITNCTSCDAIEVVQQELDKNLEAENLIQTSSFITTKKVREQGSLSWIVFGTIDGIEHVWNTISELVVQTSINKLQEVLRRTAHLHHGIELHSGNTFTLIFEELSHAIAWSLDIQHRLLEVNWDPSLLTTEYTETVQLGGRYIWNGLRLKMGLSGGSVSEQLSNDSQNPVLEASQQLCGIAIPGQILICADDVEMILPHLAANCSITVLGERYLPGNTLSTPVVSILPKILTGRIPRESIFDGNSSEKTLQTEIEHELEIHDIRMECINNAPSLVELSRQHVVGTVGDQTDVTSDQETSNSSTPDILRQLLAAAFSGMRAISCSYNGSENKTSIVDASKALAEIDTLTTKALQTAKSSGFLPRERSQSGARKRPGRRQSARSLRSNSTSENRISDDRESSDLENLVRKYRRYIIVLHRYSRLTLSLVRMYISHVENDLNHERINEDEFMQRFVKVYNACSTWDSDLPTLEKEISSPSMRRNSRPTSNFRTTFSEIMNFAAEDENEEARFATTGHYSALCRSVPGLLCKLFYALKGHFKHSRGRSPIKMRLSTMTSVAAALSNTGMVKPRSGSADSDTTLKMPQKIRLLANRHQSQQHKSDDIIVV